MEAFEGVIYFKSFEYNTCSCLNNKYDKIIIQQAEQN